MQVPELIIGAAGSLAANSLQTLYVSLREKRHQREMLDMLGKIEANTRQTYKEPL